MEKGEIYIRYGNFLGEIEKIAKFPLWKPIKLKDLDLSRGATQRAYREMKEMGFEGTIVDYICWVELLYIAMATVEGDFGGDGAHYNIINIKRTPLMRLVLKDSSYIKKAYDLILPDNCPYDYTQDPNLTYKESFIEYLKKHIITAANEQLKITELK